VLEIVGTKPSIRALFENAGFSAIDSERAIIRLGDHEQIEFARLNAEPITEIVRAASGCRLRVVFEAPEPKANYVVDETVMTPDLKRAVESNPLVRRTMELFDAQVIRVQDRPGEIPAGAPETTTDESDTD